MDVSHPGRGRHDRVPAHPDRAPHRIDHPRPDRDRIEAPRRVLNRVHIITRPGATGITRATAQGFAPGELAIRNIRERYVFAAMAFFLAAGYTLLTVLDAF